MFCCGGQNEYSRADPRHKSCAGYRGLPKNRESKKLCYVYVWDLQRAAYLRYPFVSCAGCKGKRVYLAERKENAEGKEVSNQQGTEGDS